MGGGDVGEEKKPRKGSGRREEESKGVRECKRKDGIQ